MKIDRIISVGRRRCLENIWYRATNKYKRRRYVEKIYRFITRIEFKENKIDNFYFVNTRPGNLTAVHRVFFFSITRY